MLPLSLSLRSMSAWPAFAVHRETLVQRDPLELMAPRDPLEVSVPLGLQDPPELPARSDLRV